MSLSSSPHWLSKFAYCDHSPAVLSRIYQENINVCWFKNTEQWALSRAAQLFAKQREGQAFSFYGDEAECREWFELLVKGSTHQALLSQHISLMLEMFGCLFEPKSIGFGISCQTEPERIRFHRSKSVCRMASSLGDSGEQWLCNTQLKFEPLQKGQICAEVISPTEEQIFTAQDGDILLFKGENWMGNEESPVYSRDSMIADGKARMRVSLDLLE